MEKCCGLGFIGRLLMFLCTSSHEKFPSNLPPKAVRVRHVLEMRLCVMKGTNRERLLVRLNYKCITQNKQFHFP